MSTYTKPDYSSICGSLNSAIQECDVKLRVSETNIGLREKYTEEVAKFERSIQVCDIILDNIKPLIKDISQYIANRRKESMQHVNNAIRLAGEIIADAMEGIHFQIDGDGAWLSTADGLDVQRTEGGGYRTITSAFLRAVVLSSNPQYLQTVFFDEVFALVNQENSAVLSTYLNIICQSIQVISIEQKPEVYSNISTAEYTFEKDDEFSRVKYKVIERGTTIGS